MVLEGVVLNEVSLQLNLQGSLLSGAPGDPIASLVDFTTDLQAERPELWSMSGAPLALRRRVS